MSCVIWSELVLESGEAAHPKFRGKVIGPTDAGFVFQRVFGPRNRHEVAARFKEWSQQNTFDRDTACLADQELNALCRFVARHAIAAAGVA
jgi:hypothetical protein